MQLAWANLGIPWTLLDKKITPFLRTEVPEDMRAWPRGCERSGCRGLFWFTQKWRASVESASL